MAVPKKEKPAPASTPESLSFVTKLKYLLSYSVS